LNRRLSGEVVEWFHKGASPAEAQQMLAAKGIDPQFAANVVRKTIRRSAFAAATAMLADGVAEPEVRADLLKGGLDGETVDDAIGAAALSLKFRRHPILSVVAGLALVVGGAALGFFGFFLRDGNRTGRFVTFPFAGQTAFVAGSCAAGVGCMILWGRFTRTA
ncbi:MAG TPA: hypothetical protein VGH33_03775, partial [Isosphaeraceae bacterium]